MQQGATAAVDMVPVAATATRPAPLVILVDSDDDSDEGRAVVEAPLNRWDERFQATLAALLGAKEAAEVVKHMKDIRNRRALPPSAFDERNVELYRFCVRHLPDPFKRQPKCMASMLETLEYADELCAAKYDAVRAKVGQASQAASCIDMARLVGEANAAAETVGTLHKTIVDAARADTEATIGFATERKKNPDVEAFLVAPSYDTLARAMLTMFRRVDAEQQRKRQHLAAVLESDGTTDDELPLCNKRARTDGSSSSEALSEPLVGTWLRSQREALWTRDCGKAWFGNCQCCSKALEVSDTWHAAHVLARSQGGSSKLDNLRVACARCNIDMGERHFDEFKALMGYGS